MSLIMKISGSPSVHLWGFFHAFSGRSTISSYHVVLAPILCILLIFTFHRIVTWSTLSVYIFCFYHRILEPSSSVYNKCHQRQPVQIMVSLMRATNKESVFRISQPYIFWERSYQLLVIFDLSRYSLAAKLSYKSTIHSKVVRFSPTNRLTRESLLRDFTCSDVLIRSYFRARTLFKGAYFNRDREVLYIQ